MLIHEPVTGTRVMFPEHKKVVMEPFAVPQPGPGEVVVRSLFSLMSTGTENIAFNGLYAPGSHWERYVSFPYYPGYATIGAIIDAGDSAEWRAGDLVAMRRPHASHIVMKPDDYFIAVPPDIDLRDATWFAMAKIAFHGAKAAASSLGSNVMIIGAGPIGQMATRWIAATGPSRLTVVDPAADRLELARRGGATNTIAEPIDSILPQYEADEASRPEIVIDTTGNGRVFATALALVARFGRVVVLGDTGFTGEQTLTSDVIRRGITIVGAHDIHNNAVWNNKTIAKYFFELLQSGRFNMDGLISHEFPAEQAPDGYALVNTRRAETMGVLFNWGSDEVPHS